MVLQKFRCSSDSYRHRGLVQHVRQRVSSFLQTIIFATKFQVCPSRRHHRISDIRGQRCAQMYVHDPFFVANPSYPSSLYHRRAWKQDSDYHLRYQRLSVISRHQGILYLAEPSARQDLGRDDTRGKSLNDDKTPGGEADSALCAGESTLFEHHKGCWE